jgi:hypothetical protein
MKRVLLLVFLGLVLAVSGLRAVDDETSWDAKVEQVLRTLRENGASERIVEKVLQDMTDSRNKHAVEEPGVEAEPGIAMSSEGTSNTLFGYLAGASITSGTCNSFFGRSAGTNTTTGSWNNFLGYNAGANNTGGFRNNFQGYGAGYKNTNGTMNSFVGHGAGYNNTIGTNNTFFGYSAGYKNIDADKNTFIGDVAGYSNTTGTTSTFIGSGAGYSNTSGFYNDFIGSDAGYSNTSGACNVMIGNFAGNKNTTGNYNTFIGHLAGRDNTGYENVFIGDYAGKYNTGYGNVFIGNEAGDWVSSVHETLVIDNTNTGTPLIYGNFITDRVGIANGSPGYTLAVGSGGAYCNGTQWVDGSSREVKENIEALTSTEALRAFEKLEPVKFNYKQDKEDPCLGFIAEDVPELVATKDRKGLSPMDMVAMLTKVVQEQQKTLAELKEKITILEKRPLKEN